QALLVSYRAEALERSDVALLQDVFGVGCVVEQVPKHPQLVRPLAEEARQRVVGRRFRAHWRSPSRRPSSTRSAFSVLTSIPARQAAAACRAWDAYAVREPRIRPLPYWTSEPQISST